MCPATVWIISGQRNRRKNDRAPAQELFFHEQGSSSGALFFHGPGSDFCSFSHIDILIILSRYASSWMENELNQVHKTTRIYQTFMSNLIW